MGSHGDVLQVSWQKVPSCVCVGIVHDTQPFGIEFMRMLQVSVGSVRIPPEEGSAPLQVMFATSKHLVKLGHKGAILDRSYTKDDPPVEHIDGVEIIRLRVPQVPSPKRPHIACSYSCCPSFLSVDRSNH